MPFGVDEAGKGPALGSMFAAAVYCPDPDNLPAGIADSKRLAPERREELAAAIRDDDRLRVGVAEVPTRRIDDPETDMNSLAVAAHAEAIDAALAGLEGESNDDLENPVSGLCDACDTDAERFARRVHDACSIGAASTPDATADSLEIDLDLEARHGADDESPIVGAASIVAKVERDAHVESLSAAYDAYETVGSGYPSDPNTQAFLEAYVDDHGELPVCARESWSTCEKLLAEAEQTGLGEF
ncbi:ribonuclease HII [Natronolimnohabitans innermongolicus]|uniref:Ribonuclease n=1 Tax=Natronolimnohabitans innermongolicus JCM 12255 TaxID=1227499 RepID=L9XBV1_9EURY|nr:ribonuclease HII [Natronolimnohabitans innermongolicus]ELY59102.1 ribonuclease HII [Natronolimnohabitans innermongolicus JCM 12255]